MKPVNFFSRIIEGLLSTPIITVPVVARRFDVTYHTASADVKKLLELGVLEELKTKLTRPKCFYCPKIMKIAYEEST